ncbi:phosphotransferase family protein [Nonomuraea sp. NPDC047897]|uniref:phosphotransferase family protein n=1 Tax=Nonomuraea sp. NPDC047897 TaxID=3364346 RepID=UPI00371C6EBB
MRIIGRHSRVSNSDIRRLTAVLLEHVPDDLAGRPVIRLLTGGYSGSLVALVWFDRLDPIVLKAGPAEEIRAEHAYRREFAAVDPALQAHGLSEIHGPIDIELDDMTALWSAIAYRYVGGRTFEEIEHYSDFEGFLQNYVWSANRDQAPSEMTIRECLRKVAKILTEERAGLPGPASQPLVEALPRLAWDQGILATLNTAAAFCPDLPELVDFRLWWESTTESIRVAPVPDRRTLHGDARFANILIDSVHAQIDLIDFGNGRPGHVFEDLARFEIDLLFRTTPAGEDNGNLDRGRLADAVGHLLRDELEFGASRLADHRQIRCVKLWRQAVYQALPAMTRPGALMMYRWFLLAECLKRTRWIASATVGDVGVDPASLVYTICALRRNLSGADLGSAWISTAPQILAAALHCRAAYVPTRGSERAVNRKRNDAKKAALRETAARTSTVRLLAETGQSYLSPRGTFNPEVHEVLAAGSSLQVVVCNPALPEYYGMSESYEARPGNAYSIYGDLQRKCDDSLEGYRMLREQFGSLIELRLARFGLIATILLAEGALFFEPYFRARRVRRQQVLFDSFELQFDTGGLHARTLLEETFDFYWRNSDDLESQVARDPDMTALRQHFLKLWNRSRDDDA